MARVAAAERVFTSKRLESFCPKDPTSHLDQFGSRRLSVLKRVVESKGPPLEAAHLMKGQHLDALDVSQARGEPGDLRDVLLSSVKPGTRTKRTQIGLRGPPGGGRSRASGQYPFRSGGDACPTPRLDTEQHQVDLFQFLVRRRSPR